MPHGANFPEGGCIHEFVCCIHRELKGVEERGGSGLLWDPRKQFWYFSKDAAKRMDQNWRMVVCVLLDIIFINTAYRYVISDGIVFWLSFCQKKKTRTIGIAE